MLGFSVDGLMEALGKGYWILVYGVGVLAMLLSIIAFQFKRRVTIILSNFLGQVSWVIYFLLQGDVTSAVASGLSALMMAVFSQKERWKWAVSPFTVVLFTALICGFSLLSFETWSDIFPLLAGVFAVIANSRSSEKRLRQFSLLWCLFWLLNSTFKTYPVAFANDFLCTVSTVVALIRYREKRKL